MSDQETHTKKPNVSETIKPIPELVEEFIRYLADRENSPLAAKYEPDETGRWRLIGGMRDGIDPYIRFDILETFEGRYIDVLAHALGDPKFYSRGDYDSGASNPGNGWIEKERVVQQPKISELDSIAEHWTGCMPVNRKNARGYKG